MYLGIIDVFLALLRIIDRVYRVHMLMFADMLTDGIEKQLFDKFKEVGLPQIPAEPDAWLEPLGVASLIAEGLFVTAFIRMKAL